MAPDRRRRETQPVAEFSRAHRTVLKYCGKHFVPGPLIDGAAGIGIVNSTENAISLGTARDNGM
ncbi:hypothetical protein GCM10009784_21310 [Arthrobacter parietis]|uniref:Uncharacterized protein n=1 Tax=Arthrobacter parietis TaxID=271434 RepID=A0ABN3AXN2_9MICC